MWTKRFRVIWLQLYVDHGRRFHLTLPISSYALVELLDCAVDLLDLACCFVPKGFTPNSHTLPLHATRELLLGLNNLLDSLTGSEPYDLLDIEADQVRVSLKIR